MLLALQKEIQIMHANFFAQPFDDDLLFWSKWTLCAFRLDSFIPVETSSLCVERYALLRREIELRHIPATFGVLLTAFLLAREALAAEIIKNNKAALSVVDTTYETLFDAGLNASEFDAHLHSPHGEISISRDCVSSTLKKLLNLFAQNTSNSELQSELQIEVVNDFIPVFEKYLMYRDRKKKHRSLAKKRLAKSESFRLEMESVQEHNRALIHQYIRHTDVPFFAQSMLLNYWSLKMSVVQNLGQSSLRDWQFYWTFVTRLTRYFKASQASSSARILNDDFEFLYQYFLSEQKGNKITLENAQFCQSFKEFHLQKLEAVESMKKAQRLQKPVYKNTPLKKDFNTSEKENNTQSLQHLKIEQGDLLWFYDDNFCLPCEVLLAPESVCDTALQQIDRDFSVESVAKIHRANVYVLAFDDGKGVLWFSTADFQAAFANGVLCRRLEVDAYQQSSIAKR